MVAAYPAGGLIYAEATYSRKAGTIIADTVMDRLAQTAYIFKVPVTFAAKRDDGIGLSRYIYHPW